MGMGGDAEHSPARDPIVAIYRAALRRQYREETVMPADPLDALRLPIVPVEPRSEFAEALLRRLQAGGQPERRTTPTIRYFVKDMDAAVDFYCRQLGFEEELRPSPVFAMLYRGDLRLLLSVPGTYPGGHALPDGTVPSPGGWNRILIQVADLDAMVDALRRAGVRFLDARPSGVAVRQVLLEDPSGNPIELFEPAPGYHERAR
jgi:catechol 2,3-dioxygenase-like lactoylglutathione lyase family enzyme